MEGSERIAAASVWAFFSWVALVGGNWNNAGLCGSRYVNLNNLASNTNANIGSRHSYFHAINSCRSYILVA